MRKDSMWYDRVAKDKSARPNGRLSPTGAIDCPSEILEALLALQGLFFCHNLTMFLAIRPVKSNAATM